MGLRPSPSHAVQPRVCAANDDFFRISPQQACTTTIVAQFRHADGDIDLKLQDSAGVEIGSSTSSDDDESIEFVAPNNNVIVARVFGFQAVQNRYRLVTTTVCPP